jgi:predicted ABC-type ATPase
LLVFAGPNGSGKTTATRGVTIAGEYINADDIKAVSGCSDLEAAQQAEAAREVLLGIGADFTFETVLSTDRNLNLLRRAKASGYQIRSVFVLTADVAINVARVRARVATGGHSVPEDKIRSRFERSLANLPELVALSDVTVVIDNTEDTPVQIFACDSSGWFIEPTPDWTETQIHKLVGLGA